MNQPIYSSTADPYIEPFVTGTSYKYQLLVEDWAGNTYIVETPTRVLRMDNIDPTLNISYTGISNTRYNTTQTITF